MKKKILVSFLGSTLDNKGKNEKRWESWRPSVSICQHNDLLFNEYIILYQDKYSTLFDTITKDIKIVSPKTKIIPQTISLKNPWEFEEVYSKLYDFSKLMDFDPDNNEYLFHITTGTHVVQICIFLLTESRHFPGKLIQTSPSRNQQRDPAGTYTVIDLDLSKYDKIAMRFEKQISDDISFLKSGINTKNKKFNSLIDMIEKVAIRSKDPILLTGPTGAGKSQLANRIYLLKKNHNQIKGNFIDINCATLRGDAAMSALFGHKKGAFTGALTEREGLLKAANNGILFLDEIGELGQDEQAMLLRAIEEKKYLPVGSDTEVSSDFQLICGTNQNLKKKVNKGVFRDDLLSRINLWTFEMPGLSDRKEDIEPNIEYETFNLEKNKGCHISFNKEAKEKFIKFSISSDAVWKSNFRDLNGAITRMATLAEGGRITEKIVNDEIARLKSQWSKAEKSVDENILKKHLDKDIHETIDLFDKIQLIEVIKICLESNSLSDAGRKLFSFSRNNKQNPNDADRLRKYLDRFNLSWQEIKK